MDNSRRARANEALRIANKNLSEAKDYCKRLKQKYLHKDDKEHYLFMFQSSMKRYRMALRLSRSIIER